MLRLLQVREAAGHGRRRWFEVPILPESAKRRGIATALRKDSSSGRNYR
jgi:hypothetical protein